MSPSSGELKVLESVSEKMPEHHSRCRSSIAFGHRIL
jgi:hypothetical protein